RSDGRAPKRPCAHSEGQSHDDESPDSYSWARVRRGRHRRRMDTAIGPLARSHRRRCGLTDACDRIRSERAGRLGVALPQIARRGRSAKVWRVTITRIPAGTNSRPGRRRMHSTVLHRLSNARLSRRHPHQRAIHRFSISRKEMGMQGITSWPVVLAFASALSLATVAFGHGASDPATKAAKTPMNAEQTPFGIAGDSKK